MRKTVSLHDGAVLLGVLLLVVSLLGLMFGSAVAKGLGALLGEPDGDERVLVIAVVTPTPRLLVQPTWTPFQAALPTQAADTAVPTLAPATPTAEPTPTPLPLIPDRISIPAIQVDAPVLPSAYSLVDINGQIFQQWSAPTEYAAGWQFSSAALGSPGNMVLSGHHNVHGSVFGRLTDLSEGDLIAVASGASVVEYEVTNKMILLEEGQDISVRLENARWLQPSTDERLTLVTCWPQSSNSHRLVIVARPVGKLIAAAGP